MSCPKSSPKTLLKAVSAGRTRQVRLLLDLGASMEEHDDCGQTPLIRAVLLENDRNRDKILKTLLKRGAQVSQGDVVGRNALMWACLYGRDNDVALLIEFADVDMDFNKIDINGQTALFHAVSSGNAATVKLVVSALIKYGLSTDTTDFNGTTPLIQAQILGHDICESILVYEGNAKVGLRNTNFERYSKREKWATSSLRDRSKIKSSKGRSQTSHFPPITNQKIPRTNTVPETKIKLPFDSDDEYTTSDEEFNTAKGNKPRREMSQPNTHENMFPLKTPVINCLQNRPPCKIPRSILATSTPGSVTGNVSSGEESEVDSVASTIIEGKCLKSKLPSPDLTAIYGFKEQQMTSSYRKPAVKPETPVESERVMTPTPKIKGKRIEVQKWNQLKRSLWLTGLGKMAKTKSRDNVNEEDSECKKMAGLPNIFALKNTHESPNLNVKSQSEKDKNRSYSEI